jgi:hypothetical protein
MKFVIFHEGEGQKTAVRLQEILKSRHIAADVFFTGKEWENFKPFIGEKLAGAGRLILVLSGPVISPWVTFIAGYFFALKLPFILYGGASEFFDPLISKYIIFIKTEAELLHYAGKEQEIYVSRQDQKQAKYELLENGVPFSEESFVNCVIGGNGKAVSLFIEAGFSPNLRDRFGVPVLNLAARIGNGNIVKLLLKAGAQVNQQAEDRSSSALIDAVSGKFHGIVRDLLAAKADVNLKSRDGQSALILAVGLNDEISAELLLKAGARADDPDALGASGRQYASLFNKPGMVALFNIYAPQRNAG